MFHKNLISTDLIDLKTLLRIGWSKDSGASNLRATVSRSNSSINQQDSTANSCVITAHNRFEFWIWKACRKMSQSLSTGNYWDTSQTPSRCLRKKPNWLTVDVNFLNHSYQERIRISYPEYMGMRYDKSISRMVPKNGIRQQ